MHFLLELFVIYHDKILSIFTCNPINHEFKREILSITFNRIKTPRKLLWKKNLGTVKLELEFGDQTTQFVVSPINAAIIMHFPDQPWQLDLQGPCSSYWGRRINFWTSKGIITESIGAHSDDHIFTLEEGMVDSSKNRVDTCSSDDPRAEADEEGEASVASQEQLRGEMAIYEKFIVGMLTNLGSMSLEGTHNKMKMFCQGSYDKSLQQLKAFLSCLLLEEKLEFRDGLYHLRR